MGSEVLSSPAGLRSAEGMTGAANTLSFLPAVESARRTPVATGGPQRRLLWWKNCARPTRAWRTRPEEGQVGGAPWQPLQWLLGTRTRG